MVKDSGCCEKVSKKQNSEDNLSWWQMFSSVCCAFFGVQSDRKLNEDFTKGRVWPFFVMGAVAVSVFILILIFIVKLVLFMGE